MFLASCSQKTEVITQIEYETVYYYPSTRDCFDFPEIPKMDYKSIGNWILQVKVAYDDCHLANKEVQDDINKHKLNNTK